MGVIFFPKKYSPVFLVLSWTPLEQEKLKWSWHQPTSSWQPWVVVLVFTVAEIYVGKTPPCISSPSGTSGPASRDLLQVLTICVVTHKMFSAGLHTDCLVSCWAQIANVEDDTNLFLCRIKRTTATTIAMTRKRGTPTPIPIQTPFLPVKRTLIIQNVIMGNIICEKKFGYRWHIDLLVDSNYRFTQVVIQQHTFPSWWTFFCSCGCCKVKVSPY